MRIDAKKHPATCSAALAPKAGEQIEGRDFPSAAPQMPPHRAASQPSFAIEPNGASRARAVASMYRPGPSVIRHDLYLSNCTDASDLQLLKHLGITHIMNVTTEYKNVWPDHFEYTNYQVRDRTSNQMTAFFHRAYAFYLQAQQHGGRLLVHCQQGISRSATLVLGILMCSEKLTLAQAYAAVLEARPEIEPNPQFLADLRGLEKQLFGAVTSTAKLNHMDREMVAELPPEAAFLSALRASVAAHAAQGDALILQALAHDVDLALRALPTVERPQAVAQAVLQTFEAFGGMDKNDLAARGGLKQLLDALVGHKALEATELRTQWRDLEASQEFADLLIDVPFAKSFLAALAMAPVPCPISR